jgi:hypothetical protein
MALQEINTSDFTAYIDHEKYNTTRNEAIIRVSNAPGISGWVFDVPRGETITLTSEATDHYTEDGSFLSDHIVLKPIQITLSGFVGNLVYRVPQKGSVEYAADQAASKLLAVNSFLGPLTQGATQKAAAIVSQASYLANQVNALKKKGSNVVDFFKNGLNGNKEPDPQTVAYHDLKALWKSKQIVSLQTYWEFFPTMSIVNITAQHDDLTDDYTDISVTLKELRLVNVETVPISEDLFPAPDTLQGESTTDKGKISGTGKDSKSLLYSAGESLGWIK